MPTGYQRQHPELPDYEQLHEAALGFIADGGTYTPTEIRETIAQVYDVTPEHRALRLEDGTPAYHNYVAHVLRRFTLDKFHIRHGHADKVIYTVTPTGMAAGQSSLGGGTPT